MGYKQSRRKEDDIAIVNAGFRVQLVQKANKFFVQNISLCYGGMSYVTVCALQTEQQLTGRYSLLLCNLII